jgi:hypothetical protein
MITVDEQRTALQPIFAAISGVTTALARSPKAIQARQLPLVYLSAGTARWDQQLYGSGDLAIRRTWEAHLFVREATTGREEEAESDAEPFLEVVPLALMAHPIVRLADGRAFDLILHDGGEGGIEALTYGQTDYAGIVFRFTTEISDSIEPLE